MSQAQQFYERQLALTWWFVLTRIGQDLGERYEVSTELPPKLLALVRKLKAIESRSTRARTLLGTLDAIEGNWLLGSVPPVEPRSVAPTDDWPLCT